MSYAIVGLTALFTVFIGSLFGRSLSAGRAVLWWIFLLCLLASAISPRAFAPLAHALGVEYVSNLVLAGAVVFLILQLVVEASAAFEVQRICRRLVCTIAADHFPRSKSTSQSITTTARALVIVPCFNEEDSLPELLERLDRVVASSDATLDYCIIDDCSFDATAAILGERAPQHHTTHLHNMGVSGALMTGMLIAERDGYDFAIQCDADGQHPVERIPDLVGAALRERTDMLIASRFASAPLNSPGNDVGRDHSTTLLRRAGSSILVLALRALFPGIRVTDPTSGFRVYSRRAIRVFLRNMPERFPEPEMIAIATGSGLRVGEVRVPMAPRQGGTSSIAGLRGALYMVKVMSALLGYRLARRGRHPLPSHRTRIGGGEQVGHAHLEDVTGDVTGK